MKIAQITDIHLKDYLAFHFKIDVENNLKTIFSEIVARKIDFVVFTGDFGNPDSLAVIHKLLNEYKLQFVYCLGNHDTIENLLKCGFKHGQSPDFKIENYNCIFFDSANGVFDNEKGASLLRKIDKNEKNIIFTHFPLIETDSAFFDTSLGLKNNFFEEMAVDILDTEIYIFCGHYHRFNKSVKNRMTQIICPAVVMQIKESNDNKIITDTFDFGFLEIEINNHEVNYYPVMFPGYGVDTPW